MPMAYGYTRFSHRDQTDGMSEAFQRERIERYMQYDIAIDYKGVEWSGEIFSDRSVSAFRTRFSLRKEGKKLLAKLQPGDHIIFYSLDRGFRNVRDLCRMLDDWRDKGITPHFLQQKIDAGTSTGKIMLTMFAAVAEWQSAVTSERIKEGKRISRALGKAPQEPPIGFKWVFGGGKKYNGYYAHELSDRSLMQEIVRMRDKEHMNFEKISVALQYLLCHLRGQDVSEAINRRLWDKSKCYNAYVKEKRYQTEGAYFLEGRYRWIVNVVGSPFLPLQYPLVPGMPVVPEPPGKLPSWEECGFKENPFLIGESR